MLKKDDYSSSEEKQSDKIPPNTSEQIGTIKLICWK